MGGGGGGGGGGGPREQLGVAMPQQCRLPDHPLHAGCTAVVALVVNRVLYVANAGDSRAILCRGGAVVELSHDHKPASATEHGRITAAGGFVREMNGHHRVNGNLNLSRAIGDLKYKQNGALPASAQIITAEPDVIVQPLVPEDEFMVLACDGVWDVMSNEEVCDFVRQRVSAGGSTLAAIAEEVLDNCVAEDPKKTGGIGGDNMTCVVVTFDTTTVPGVGAPGEFAGGKR